VVNFLEECKSENKSNNIESGLDSGIVNYTELPLSFLRGWIKFI
jgi:hypothetical protein